MWYNFNLKFFINGYKYWYKFFNKQAYLDYKNANRTESTVRIFKSRYEDQINQIQKKIQNQNKLTFLHSGHIGDIINILPIGVSYLVDD